MLDVKLFQMENFLSEPYETGLAPLLKSAHDRLQDGSGLGGDFTGWVRLPQDYDKEEFARIKAAAAKIQGNSQALVVIGIGGSYLGARGVIDCLCSPNYNLKKKSTPNVYFCGNGLSADAMQEVLDLLEGVDFSVNVISKSGTTTEPAVAFRFFRAELEKRYGKEGANERIFATTDKARGALKSLATSQGWETFVVPDNVGGRYSVLTAVGLLPIAVAGIDIDALMGGAAEMMDLCAKTPSWPATTPPSALCWSGGSSSTARARGRTARACSPPAWSLRRTSTPWASICRTAPGTSLRPWCGWGLRSTSCTSPRTRTTATD